MGGSWEMRGLGNVLGAEMDVRDWLDGTGRCWRRGQAGEGGDVRYIGDGRRGNDRRKGDPASYVLHST